MAKPASSTQQKAPGTSFELSDAQGILLLALMVVVFFLDLVRGHAYLWEDFVYQWYPFRQFAATTLARGELPLWNPYTFNGMPFLAEIQTEVFYLPMTLLTLLAGGGKLGVYWLQLVNILHYLLAGGGMYLLARSYGLRSFPALVSAIAYGFSGFMVTHAIHQVIIAVAAWYPLILLLFRKALHAPRWTGVFVAALVLGHSFLGGSPQMSLFLYLLLFFVFLFELTTAFSGKQLLSRPALVMTARAAAVIVLSLGITMVQFLPTREMSELSARAQITFEKGTEGSLAWSQLVTLVYPRFFGSSHATEYAYWGPGPYWHFWETCIYAGILPVLLTVLAFPLVRRKPVVGLYLAVGVFALLFSFGGNFFLYRLFFDYIPGFAAFRNPARMGILFTLSVALLSGVVIQHLLYETRSSAETKRFRTILFAAVGIPAAFWMLALSGSLDTAFPFLAQARIAPLVRKELWTGLLLLLASGGLLYGILKRGQRWSWGGAAAAVLLFLDLFRFGADHNNAPLNPEDHFRRAEPIVRSLKAQEGLFRVNTRNTDGMVMDRNQGLVDQIFMMEGYTPLVLQRVYPPAPDQSQFHDLQNVRFFTVTDSVRRTLSLQERTSVTPRAYMVYATRVAASGEEVQAIMSRPDFDHRSLAVLEGDAGVPLPPATGTPAWKTTFTSYRNNSCALTVETDRPGCLVISETYYPGWKARVDGVETTIHRTNYTARGIFVPAGTHTVTMEFASGSFLRGATVTLLTLLVCVAGIVFARRRPVSGTSPSSPRG